MKKFKLPFVLSILIILTLSACGPTATEEPALSANDIANTAVAQAWVAVTLTQAALPTATFTSTPLPPTPTWTPLPTITFVPTAVQPTVAPVGAADPCNQPPPYQPKGTLVQVQITNEAKGNVSLALGMNQANSLGECGTYSFSLSRFDTPVVKVLAGCYWAYGWVTGEGGATSTTQTTSALCFPDTSQTWSIVVGPEVVAMH